MYSATSIGEGYSGGPVFDQSGRLVGLHVLSRPNNGYKVMVAIKIDAALGALDSLGFPVASFNKLTIGGDNTPMNSEQLRAALSAADVRALKLSGSTNTVEIQEALRQPSGDGKTTVARRFFENSSKSPDALAWFESTLVAGLNPNMTVTTEYYGKEGVLLEAMRAGNAEAMKALLRHGASPHAYEDLFLTPYPITRFIFPFEFIVGDDRFDQAQKKDLAKAFLMAGAVIPKVLAAGGFGPGPEMYEAQQIHDKLASRLGLNLLSTPTICERPSNAVCKQAKDRTGVDWCGAIGGMPKAIEDTLKSGGPDPVYSVQLQYLLNIDGNKAYFLGSESAYSDYVLVEIPKDASSWTILRFMEPEAGMGLCKQSSEEGIRADRCWRRISLHRTQGTDEMSSDEWSGAWRLESGACSNSP